MDLAPSLLLVEDEEAVARATRRVIEPAFNNVVVASSVATAREAIETRRIVAATLDYMFPDGCCFELIDELRRTDAEMPILVFSGRLEPEPINRCVELGIPFAAKAGASAILRAFAELAARHAATLPDPSVLRSVDSLAADVGLTAKERLIVLLAVRVGESRTAIARMAGVSENTLKTHIRSILGKTGTARLSAVLQRLRS